MGHALAEAARDLGAKVRLVTSAEIDPPSAVDVRKVDTSEEMREAMMALAGDADVVIMAAAVADFAPSNPVKGKIKKSSGLKSIELKPTTDILKELGTLKREGRILIGFAAEHGAKGSEEALRKCRDKSCDMICLNDISRPDVGFSVDENEITIIYPDAREKRIPKGSKRAVAGEIMKEVAGLFRESRQCRQ